MAIPESALLLAGFVLAHAAWSVSDLPEGDLLCPFAIVESDGKRQLHRFVADSQDAAIANGKAELAKIQSSGNARTWAFAREGVLRQGDKKVDVLVVEFWESGMQQAGALIQRFVPFARSAKFQLLGSPEVIVGGAVPPEGKSADFINTVQRGIAQHSKAELWHEWLVRAPEPE